MARTLMSIGTLSIGRHAARIVVEDGSTIDGHVCRAVTRSRVIPSRPSASLRAGCDGEGSPASTGSLAAARDDTASDNRMEIVSRSSMGSATSVSRSTVHRSFRSISASAHAAAASMAAAPATMKTITVNSGINSAEAVMIIARRMRRLPGRISLPLSRCQLPVASCQLPMRSDN